MDRYARACPTCGAARAPGSIHRFVRGTDESRRYGIIALTVLVVVGLIGSWIAFHTSSPKDPNVEACRAARGLQIALVGDRGDFADVAILARDAALIRDPDIKRETLAINASVDKEGEPSISPVSTLVRTCRARGFLGPG